MSTTALIATVVVVAVLVIFFIIGWNKGFLRTILKTASLLVTLIIAAFLLQPATNFLAENTKLETQLEERLEKRLGFTSEEKTEGKDTSVDGETNNEKENTDDILPSNKLNTEAEKTTTYDLSQLEEIEQNLSAEDKADAEEEIIKGLAIPGLLKNSLIAKNSIEEYIKIGVDSFKQYVVKSIAMLELKIITYVGLVVAIFIVIRLLMLFTKLLEKVPIIKGANRFLGALIGLLEGLLFIWLAGLIISLIAQTEFGIEAVKVIQESFVLTFFYDNNLILAFTGTLF